MTKTGAIDMTADHRRLVVDILRAHLPAESSVWVFGSRAAGRARRYSDLDLAIDARRRLSLDETAVLREALSESDLPYRVDIVDWHAIDDRFQAIVNSERVPLVVGAADGNAPGVS